jgi:hypothetical protein
VLAGKEMDPSLTEVKELGKKKEPKEKALKKKYIKEKLLVKLSLHKYSCVFSRATII